MKAFIGMGLLGSNFVKAMLRRGEKVQVWNRTTSKAQELESFGATAFKEVKDAVANADVIHITLRDDASVEEVLTEAEKGLKPGAILVDHTTTSVSGAIQRTKKWEAKGFHYQHAPVLMGPKNAFESTGFILVSGNQTIIEKINPGLSKMTGEVINFGDKAGQAAGMKLIANLFLLVFTSGVGDALNLARSLNIPIEDVQKLFSAWNPGTVNGRLNKIAEGRFQPPSWELTMARKDARLMMEEAGDNKNRLEVIPAIAAEMDRWIDKGHAHDDWTIFAADESSNK